MHEPALTMPQSRKPDPALVEEQVADVGVAVDDRAGALVPQLVELRGLLAVDRRHVDEGVAEPVAVVLDAVAQHLLAHVAAGAAHGHPGRPPPHARPGRRTGRASAPAPRARRPRRRRGCPTCRRRPGNPCRRGPRAPARTGRCSSSSRATWASGTRRSSDGASSTVEAGLHRAHAGGDDGVTAAVDRWQLAEGGRRRPGAGGRVGIRVGHPDHGVGVGHVVPGADLDGDDLHTGMAVGQRGREPPGVDVLDRGRVLVVLHEGQPSGVNSMCTSS